MHKGVLGWTLVVSVLVSLCAGQGRRCRPQGGGPSERGGFGFTSTGEGEDWGVLPKAPLTDQEKLWFESLGGDAQPRGGPAQKRVHRKEFRQLTKAEYSRLKRALVAMRADSVDSSSMRSEYEVFISYHHYQSSPAAHRGASFLPWHREYLWRFERALQRHEPGVFIPYWDSSLEAGLPFPEDSVLWSPHLAGNSEGAVVSGLPAHWSANKECVYYNGRLLGQNVTRHLDQSPFGETFTQEKIDQIMNETAYLDIGCLGCCFESHHDRVHVYVGGHLGIVECAPNDPMFWMHHAFIDYLWEEFRTEHQQTDPEDDYPEEPLGGLGVGRSIHKPYEPMEPWSRLYNIQGMGSHYTKYYYQYAPRPTTCKRLNDCGSPYLWCYEGRCVSKIQERGRCETLPNHACYGYRNSCIKGVCRPAFNKSSKNKEFLNESVDKN